jgi:hypothetical protein
MIEIRVNEEYPPDSGRSLTYQVKTDKIRHGFKVIKKWLKMRKKEIDKVIEDAKM